MYCLDDVCMESLGSSTFGAWSTQQTQEISETADLITNHQKHGKRIFHM